MKDKNSEIVDSLITEMKDRDKAWCEGMIVETHYPCTIQDINYWIKSLTEVLKSEEE